MKKRIFAALAALLLLLTPLLAAAQQYLIADSDKRLLTREELREWDYKSLGYIMNEIIARHGNVFLPEGGEYDRYFSGLSWYVKNTNPDNQTMVYDQLTPVEMVNMGTIKAVRAEIRKAGGVDSIGKYYLNYITYDVADGVTGHQMVFKRTELDSDQMFNVYSAPDTASYRGANGKACLSTKEAVYIAGWEGDWLLVMYGTNHDAMRVGYIKGKKLADSVTAEPLSFAYANVTCSRSVTLTDDPATGSTAIVKLKEGEAVTYLASLYEESMWAYVETKVDGKTVRGFIPADAL